MKTKMNQIIKKITLTLCAMFAILAGVSVQAQTYTWDPLLNKSGSDGAGTWDVTTANWATGSADVVWPNTAAGVAIIGSGKGAAGTIALSPATIITNGGITFNSPLSGNYTLNGGTNYLAGATPTITVNGSNALILSSLQGASGLTKAGTATLALGGANTYSGPTDVNQGTLQMTSASGQPRTLPVLYYNYNNISGSSVVNGGTGGSSMNGTLTGSATIATGGGVLGHNGLSIPAASSANVNYVRINSPVVQFTQASTWTLAMWVQTSTAGACYAYQGGGGWASGNICFYLDAGSSENGPQSGGHQGCVSYGQGWQSGTAGNANDGAWHFLTMVNNGGTIQFYFDGAADANSANFYGGAYGVGTRLYIGGAGDTGDGDVSFNGTIGDTWVYNVALTQSQVQAIMFATNGPQVSPITLPPSTTLAVASTGTFDLNGQAVQAAGLSGAGIVTSSISGGLCVLTNASANTFSGTITGPLSLTLDGTGSMTLPSVNTYSGATLVNAGTLNITGSLEPTNPTNTTSDSFTIGGFTNTNAVVNFSGAFLTNYQTQIGAVSGAVGALYQTAGVMDIVQAGNGSDFQIGNAVGAFGYYYLGAGASLFCNEVGVGGEGVSVAGFAAGAGTGLMEVNGGTVADTGWIVLSRVGSGVQAGVLNVYPGSSIQYAGGGLVVNWGNSGTSIINVLGGTIFTTNNVSLNLNESGNAGNTGILNLNGGVCQAAYINGGANNTYVNFNGGTLQANENQGVMMTGLTAAYVFGAGGTINNNGYNIAIGQPLVSPPGKGLNGAPVIVSGGVGYITPPILTVVRGTGDTTGADATAIAQIDTSTGGPTSGQVTNVIITCPGVNYTATPTFALTGGGATTPASITAPAPSANSTGNLTFTGSGITTISGSLTYSGAFTINQGALQVIGSGQATSTPIFVNDGARFIEAPASTDIWSPANLTIGSVNGTIMQVTASAASQPYLSVGNLTLKGTTTIEVFGDMEPGITYSLLSYTNLTGTLTAANFKLPNGVTGTPTAVTASGETIWSVMVVSVTPTIWESTVSGTWDINITANWSAPNGGTTYLDDSPVLFDETHNTGGIYVVTNVTAALLSPSTVHVINNVNNYTLGSNVVIGGGGGLIKDGLASLTNIGASTYTGPTLINNGSLVIGGGTVGGLSSPIGNNSPVTIANLATASLNLNNNSTQVGSLTGGGGLGGNVTLGSGTLTLGADGSAQTYGGVISGTGGLTMMGAGSLTITNTNAFTGALTIGPGNSLTISGPEAALGTFAGSAYTYAAGVADNGILTISSALAGTYTGAISGSGLLILDGPGNVTVNNNTSSFSGNIVINGGFLHDTTGQNGNNCGLGAINVVGRQVIINSGATLSLDNGGGNDLSGGTGPEQIVFVVNPGGTLFNGSANGNIYVTNIFLNGGTMNAGSANPNNSDWPSWDLAGSIIVATNPSIMTCGSVGTSGNGVGYSLGAGASTGYQTAFVVSPTTAGSLAGLPDLTVSSSLYNSDSTQNATGFNLSGGGTMALTVNNWFTGPITISAGQLVLADPGQLRTGNYAGNISIASGGTLVVNTGTTSGGQTLTGVISGAGSLKVNAAGAICVLSNATETYTGPTAVSAGTLTLAGATSIASSPSILISSGATLNVAPLTAPYSVPVSQTVMGFGGVSGNFTAPANMVIEGGVPGTFGTLTFNNNLTMAAGASINLALQPATSGASSSIAVTGNLSCTGTQVFITAPNTTQDLDPNNYTLVTDAAFSGSVSPAVIWTVAPANANHYYVTNINNNIVLAYSAIPIPVPGGVTVPASVLRNQSALLNVTVNPGQGTVTNVSVDASSVGVLTNVALTQTTSGGATWTNSIPIGPSVLAGAYLLPITAIDNVPVTGYGDVTLIVVVSTETWAGGGSSPWNFDTAANWAIETGQTASYAPGYVGDSLVFAGTAGLTPVMDNNYSVNGLSFASGAGTFAISASGSDVLTVTGGITNLGVSNQTLNLLVSNGVAGPVFIDSAKGNLALTKGFADANGGLTILGTSNVTLSGTSTFTGPLDVRQGTLTLNVPLPANTNLLYVGDGLSAGSNAILTLSSGGSLTVSAGGGALNYGMITGNATNSAAVVNVTTGGSLNVSTGELGLGGGTGSYDYLNMTGGNVSLGSFLVVGLNNDRARFDMSGGTFTIASNVMTIGANYGQSNAYGVVNLSGGTFNDLNSESYAGRGGGIFVGEFGTGILNISGTAVVNAWGDTNISIGVWSSGNSGGANPNGTVNLLGGALVTAQVAGGNGNSTFNFNGGLLSNYAGSITWTTGTAGPAFMYNINNALIYSGGAFIDDGGASIIVNQGLGAPTGYGVSSIVPNAKGSGYIAPPVVIITGGTGVGAMANAVVSGGQVTGYTITCPGTGYSSGDTLTITLVGGGGTGATATNAPVVPNTGGGLTYTSEQGTGYGSLTLTAASTYSGTTTISNGTLILGTGGSLSHSTNILVGSAGIFSVSALSSFTLASNQTLSGSGVVSGLVNAGSTSRIYPGMDPAVGTLTLGSGLNMESGAIATFDLTNAGTAAGGANDQVVVNGGSSSVIFLNNIIHIKALGGVALDKNNPYILFQNNTGNGLAGLPSVIPVFDVAPSGGTANWYIQPDPNNPNSIDLLYSSGTLPTGNGSVTAGGISIPSGTPATNIIRNTSINLSVTVTSGTVNSMSLNLGAYNGNQYSFTQSGSTWTATGVVIPPGMPVGPTTLTIVAYGSPLDSDISLPVNVLATADVWSGADVAISSNPTVDDNANWQKDAANQNAAPGYVGDSVIFAGNTPGTLAPIFEQNYTFNGIGFASGAGAFVLSSSVGSVGVTGGITNNSATGETVNFPLSLTGNGTIFNAASGALLFSNNVTGSGQFNVAGSGGVELQGVASYTGGTVISNGASLIVGPTGQWQNTAGQSSYAGGILDNGSLTINSTGSETNTGAISGTGGLTMNGPGSLTLNNSGSTFTGNILVNGGTLNDNAGSSGTGSAFGSIATVGRTVTATNGATISLNNTGGNDFSGGTGPDQIVFVINQGSTLVNTSGNVYVTNIFLNGGTIEANATEGQTQWPTWDLAGSIIVGTSPSTMTASQAGVIGNGWGYSLGANNAAGYQTPFVVSPTTAGSLAGKADLTVSATLYNSDSTQSATGFNLTGGGTMALAYTNFFNGPITISNGIVNLACAESPGLGGPLGSNGLIIFAGGTLQYSAANQFDYSGRISTAAGNLVQIDTAGQSVTFATNMSSSGGTLTKLGLGTLTLTAANTYSGLTTVSNGLLVVGTGGSIAKSSGVFIDGGATFDVSSLASPYVWPASSSVGGSGTAATPAVLNTAGAVTVGSSSSIILNYDGTDPALTINGSLALGGANPFVINGAPLPNGQYNVLYASGGITDPAGYPPVTGTAIGLTSQGSISVNGNYVVLTISSINPLAPPIQFSLSGKVLTLSWPTNSGWTLQSNSINVAVPGDWFSIPGSSSATTFPINISTAKTNVFYRLYLP
jgi:autotransporter-associated beta strand protein